MMPTTCKTNAGFTIIELLISLTIMSFISLFTYQATTRSFILRENLTQDGDFYNSIRIALDIFSRDITHIYSPQTAAFPFQLGKTEPDQKKPGVFATNEDGEALQLDLTVYPFWGAQINKSGVRPSRFQGEETKLSFVSNSHMRLFKDSQESEFSKITYSYEDDKLASVAGIKAFVKRENTDVFTLDRENKESEVRYILLSNVKGLRFKYLDGAKDSWETRWDNTNQFQKNKFPSMIEIEVDVELPKSKNTFTVMQRLRSELAL